MIPSILLCLPLLLGGGSDPHKLVKIKLTPEINVAVPRELVAVSSEEVAQHYPSVRPPLGLFSNKDRTADFSVSTSATYWPDANLQLAQEFFKSSIYNLYDHVNLISQGTRELYGKHYIYFELNALMGRSAHLAPMLRYIYVQYLIEPNLTLTFSFSCMKLVEREWKETAHAMMKRIRVK